MAWRGGKWSKRPTQGQIEEQAVQKVAEFRRKLQAAGLSVPEIPPVPVEYIALTITELSLRGRKGLAHDGKPLAGLLDMERTEILYEEDDPPGRQNFTIAHELGHYFLHYLPAVELARQPTLFDAEEFPKPATGDKLERVEKPAARFYRCGDQAVNPAGLGETAEDGEATAPAAIPKIYGRIGRRELEDPDSKAYLAKIIRFKELADRIEWEANIFARGLLMPSDLVRWLNKKYGGDVEAIAAELQVSLTALRYRLNTLGLRKDEDKGLGPGYNLSKSKSENPPVQGTFF